ncbi:MAG: ribosome silencing factor [Proteobacteria bacterium]|nr:ribosome silencing factor [Pseudomonadota bacterium]
MYPKIKATTIAKLASGKLATDIVLLGIKKLSSVADYLVIVSAGSERQVSAIAEEITDGLKKKGQVPLGVEGIKEGRWALVDYGDVVAHVFTEGARAYYDLDGLWADAERTEIEETGA